jgi:predicted transcriptional regulator
MGHTRQKKVQIEHRRAQVAELYLKGETQAAIARELGVSQATISSDLKAIRKEWKESRVRDYDEALAEQLKRQEVLRPEAWKGWKESWKPAETTRVIQKNGEKRAEKTVRERSGDPRFLKILLSINERCCRLLGLDEAADAAIEPPDKEAITAKATSIAWDFFNTLILGNGPDPEVIDHDYIERYVEEQMESGPHAIRRKKPQ